MNTDRDHLDAETVAAWMDGGLDGAALAAAEAHASNCDRCQELLATVTKTLPEAAGSVSATGSLKATGGAWWRWWMAPIAATAAAVTLWMVVPQEQLQQQTKAETSELAGPAPAASAPARDAVAAPSAPPSKPFDQQAARQSSEEANRFAETNRQARAPITALEKKTQAAPAGQGAANVASTVARDRRDAQEERLARVEAASAEASAPRTEPSRAPAAPPPAAAVAAAPAETTAMRDNAPDAQLRKQVAPLVFVSPDPRYRWRATPDGIDFSVDGGRTWLPVRLPQGEVVTGGASPSPLGCWLVGRRGLVLLATDGTNFTRIPFPETVDLASVTSKELRIAVVTTVDGRVFRTENAGRNWTRQK